MSLRERPYIDGRGHLSSPTQPILDLFAAHRRFLLSGHENPDGDALGAQVALFHLLTALGKEPVIFNPDPLGRSLRFLERHTPFRAFRPGAPLPEFDVVVLLDCARLERLGPLGEVLRARRPRIAVIDHHVGSEHGDGSVAFVDSEAPATGALVRELWRASNRPLTPVAAEGVFLSLVSDTGWFRYSNTDARVLALASELVAAGVEPSSFYDRIYRQNLPDSVGVLAAGLATHQLRFANRYVYATLARAVMERAARADFDTDGVMEPLRALGGVEVVGLFKERSEKVVKLSLRSQGDVDVQAIAAALGGGGHRKAAGATLNMTLADALAAVEARVGAALRALGAGDAA